MATSAVKIFGSSTLERFLLLFEIAVSLVVLIAIEYVSFKIFYRLTVIALHKLCYRCREPRGTIHQIVQVDKRNEVFVNVVFVGTRFTASVARFIAYDSFAELTVADKSASDAVNVVPTNFTARKLVG